MDLTCPASTVLGSNILPFINPGNPLNVAGASLPLLLGFLGEENTLVDGFITSISVGSSYNWYMALTDFESIFLGIIFLQIAVLRYLEILPLNVNNWIIGDPSGKKRKRRSILKDSTSIGCDKDMLAESAFALLRKLDEHECVPRTLCVVQSAAIRGHPITKETRNLFSALKMSSKRRVKGEHSSSAANSVKCKPIEKQDLSSDGSADSDMSQIKPESGIIFYEEAVMAGIEDSQSYGDITSYSNSTVTAETGLCDKRYTSCSLTRVDIIHYFDTIADAGML